MLAVAIFALGTAAAAAPPDPVESLPVPNRPPAGAYPYAAGTEATGQRCLVSVSVDATGQATDVRAARCDPLLVDAAETAVRRFRWKPAVVEGNAVPVTVVVGVRFLESHGDGSIGGLFGSPPPWTLEASSEPGCTLHLEIGPDYRVASRATNDLRTCAPGLPALVFDPGFPFPDGATCERDFAVGHRGKPAPPWRFDACGPAADVALHALVDSLGWDQPPTGPVRLIATFDADLPRRGVPELFPLVGAWARGDAAVFWTPVDDVLYGVTFDAKPDGTPTFRVDAIQRVDGRVELASASGPSYPTRFELSESDGRTFTFRTPADQLPASSVRFAREPRLPPTAHRLEVTRGDAEPVVWELASRDRSSSLDRAMEALVADVSQRGAAAWLDAFAPNGRVWAGDRWNMAPSEAATGIFAQLSTGHLTLATVANGLAQAPLGFTTGSWRFEDDSGRHGGTWLAIWKLDDDGAWRIERLLWDPR